PRGVEREREKPQGVSHGSQDAFPVRTLRRGEPRELRRDAFRDLARRERYLEMALCPLPGGHRPLERRAVARQRRERSRGNRGLETELLQGVEDGRDARQGMRCP